MSQMGTKEEINEMFDALERTSPVTDAPIVEEVVEVPPDKVEDKVETPPVTEAPVVEKVEKVDDIPPKEEPVIDELAQLKKENEELRLKVADKVVEVKPKEKPPATDAPIEDQDFLKGVDVDEVTREPGAFNKLLNTIYKKAVESVRGEVRKTKEETIQSIPSIVNTNMELQKTLKEMSDKFYETNKDLQPFKKVVAVVFEEIASQNPKLPYNEVLGKVGVETRKRLELKSTPVIVPDTKDDDGPPSLPRVKKGGRITQPKTESNPVISQIDEMNKTLHR
jgi:regulator of replication initiation timing